MLLHRREYAPATPKEFVVNVFRTSGNLASGRWQFTLTELTKLVPLAAVATASFGFGGGKLGIPSTGLALVVYLVVGVYQAWKIEREDCNAAIEALGSDEAMDRKKALQIQESDFELRRQATRVQDEAREAERSRNAIENGPKLEFLWRCGDTNLWKAAKMVLINTSEHSAIDVQLLPVNPIVNGCGPKFTFERISRVDRQREAFPEIEKYYVETTEPFEPFSIESKTRNWLDCMAAILGPNPVRLCVTYKDNSEQSQFTTCVDVTIIDGEVTISRAGHSERKL